MQSNHPNQIIKQQRENIHLSLFYVSAPAGRRKRAVLFPEDNSQQGREIRQFDQYHHSPQQQAFHGGSHSVNNDDYFQRYNIGSLGLSQTDLEQLRRLPDNLKYEYGHEMEQLEAAASEPKEEEIQDYLSVANEFDNGACIQKSICEIMSRGNRTANQFENQILEYYRYTTAHAVFAILI